MLFRKKNIFRIGQGYDVHRFAPNRRLILGGVEIPYDMGLYGHSDADVLVHAICDALLGAAALGDIGKLFPDSDNRYLNIDSMVLLKHCVKLLKENGYTICDIDATVIAQKPKISVYTMQMRKNIARACDISVSQVSVKATTEEGLGFTGQLLGISSQAIALIQK